MRTLKQFPLIVLLSLRGLPVSSGKGTATDAPAEDASVVLTRDNFTEATRGKSTFILFYAPWCSHSQSLAPAWARLAADWAGHGQGLVGRVDCTAGPEVERWCDKDLGIVGFPTILYGDASLDGALLREYNGDKEYADLAAFANQTIAQPVCSPANLAACGKPTRRRLESYLKLPPAKLEREEANLEKQVDDIERNFQKEFSRMQARYDDRKQKYEFFSAKQKRTLKEMRTVLKEKLKEVK